MTRTEIRDLWRAHGGSQHGPRVETMTMPEASFYEFVAAVEAAVRADERERIAKLLDREAVEAPASDQFRRALAVAIAAAIRNLGESKT